VETFQSIGNASKVLNIVSTGVDGELLLTFTFEWEHKEIEAGSEEALKKQRQYQETAPRGVVGAINAIRQMVKEGKL
jgi:Acetylaranotin biosynthesis cluster protein L